MAISSYEPSLARLLIHEGGYTDHPADPGGPTNFGITIYDYRKYVKPAATAADVKAMTLPEAKSIYRAKYWDAQKCSAMPAGVDDSIFDYGVNSGIGRSGKVLRRILSLPDNTSVVTDDVLRAIEKRDPKLVINAINDERLRFLQSLRTWDVFGKGWGRRVIEVRAFSLQLAGAAPVAIPNAQPEVQQTGKGVVPPPTVVKAVIAKGAPVGGAATGVTWHEWVAVHPWETGAIAIGSVIVIGGALYAVNRWHQSKQEAPTPGLVPVPVAA
jgi:lysozyme family protein